MATIAEKMAVSLEELRKLQEQHPCVVLQGTKEIGNRKNAFDQIVG